jgi:oxygen-independent coproporphyrinogen-3 oxidase
VAALRDSGPPDPPTAVYVHVPFCRDRCTYCAFTTVTDDPDRHAALLDALLAEAHAVSSPSPLRSLYVGGGTPGLLDEVQLRRLVDGIRSLWSFSSEVEITLEVNPTNVTRARLDEWASIGVTRLSLGVQTFDDGALTRLARRHDAADALAALEVIASHGPSDWSADLLVGWHGQDKRALESDVRQMLAFEPPHVSVYGLTVERGTPLASRAAAGHVVTAPTALLERFDDAWSGRLAASGYERYEVSNFARPGHRSRHNQAYWANASYLGLGPGSSSSLHPYRWTNRPDLDGYLEAVRRGHGTRIEAERLDPFRRLLESLAIGLRTSDGLAVDLLNRRFGDAWGRLVLEAGAELLRLELLSLNDGRLRIPAAHLTKADRIVLDLARGMHDGDAAHRSDEPDAAMAE